MKTRKSQKDVVNIEAISIQKEARDPTLPLVVYRKGGSRGI